MIDVSSILTDPELGGTTFIVTRPYYARELGEVIPDGKEEFSVAGNIQPATSEDLLLFPEEERSEEMIIILSRFRFSLGETDDISFSSADIVTWREWDYRVIKVKNWHPQGNYYKAWAAKQKQVRPVVS